MKRKIIQKTCSTWRICLTHRLQGNQENDRSTWGWGYPGIWSNKLLHWITNWTGKAAFKFTPGYCITTISPLRCRIEVSTWGTEFCSWKISEFVYITFLHVRLLASRFACSFYYFLQIQVTPAFLELSVPLIHLSYNHSISNLRSMHLVPAHKNRFLILEY